MYDLTPKNEDGMNIREEANTNKPPIGELNFGEHAKGDEIYQTNSTDKWLHITSPMVGWIAIVHNGVELSTVTVDGEPPKGEFPLKFRLTNVETGESAEYERKAE